MRDGRAGIAEAVHETDYIWVLRALARKGARAVIGPAGSISIVVSGKAAASFKAVPGSIWALLVERRLVAPHDGDSWDLTARGRTELKKRLSAPANAPVVAGHAISPHRSVPSRTRPQFNPEESPLTWLRSRRDKDGESLISETEFMAGERLRRDFHVAHLEPRVTASWNGAGAGSGARRSAPGVGLELQDHVVAARERVHRAL